MKTSVVIPVYGALKYTRQLLRALLAFTPPDQLIVVDNGSTDGTAEFLDDISKDFWYSNCDFQHLDLAHNCGYGKAMNLGINFATHDCLILMNNDVKIITDDWSEEIRREAMAHPDTLFGAQLITNNELVRTIDGTFIPYLSGFILALSRESLNKLSVDGKLFDERFFAYYEDVDLTQRAFKAGIAVKTLEDLGVFHFGGKTGFSLPNQPEILLESRKAYAEKYGVTFMPVKGLDA